MAHDNYDKFYTWDKGTLILDPGVFAWDEPHLRICDQPIPFANAFDKIADDKFSKSCDYPARLLSYKHTPAPATVLSKCETIVPGRSYCCPPYAMPENWRMDYLPMDYNPASLGSEVDYMTQENLTMSPEIMDYVRAARKYAEEVAAGQAPAVNVVTEEADAIYKFLSSELERAGVVAEDTAATVVKTVEQSVEEVPEIVPPIVKTADEVAEPARETVRRWPLASIGFGIAMGMIAGHLLAR